MFQRPTRSPADAAAAAAKQRTLLALSFAAASAVEKKEPTFLPIQQAAGSPASSTPAASVSPPPTSEDILPASSPSAARPLPARVRASIIQAFATDAGAPRGSVAVRTDAPASRLSIDTLNSPDSSSTGSSAKAVPARVRASIAAASASASAAPSSARGSVTRGGSVTSPAPLQHRTSLTSPVPTSRRSSTSDDDFPPPPPPPVPIASVTTAQRQSFVRGSKVSPVVPSRRSSQASHVARASVSTQSRPSFSAIRRESESAAGRQSGSKRASINSAVTQTRRESTAVSARRGSNAVRRPSSISSASDVESPATTRWASQQQQPPKRPSVVHESEENDKRASPAPPASRLSVDVGPPSRPPPVPEVMASAVGAISPPLVRSSPLAGEHSFSISPAGVPALPAAALSPSPVAGMRAGPPPLPAGLIGRPSVNPTAQARGSSASPPPVRAVPVPTSNGEAGGAISSSETSPPKLTADADATSAARAPARASLVVPGGFVSSRIATARQLFNPLQMAPAVALQGMGSPLVLRSFQPTAVSTSSSMAATGIAPGQSYRGMVAPLDSSTVLLRVFLPAGEGSMTLRGDGLKEIGWLKRRIAGKLTRSGRNALSESAVKAGTFFIAGTRTKLDDSLPMPAALNLLAPYVVARAGGPKTVQLELHCAGVAPPIVVQVPGEIQQHAPSQNPRGSGLQPNPLAAVAGPGSDPRGSGILSHAARPKMKHGRSKGSGKGSAIVVGKFSSTPQSFSSVRQVEPEENPSESDAGADA